MPKTTRLLLAFRCPPHLHRSICAVCKAAEKELQENNLNCEQSTAETTDCNCDKSQLVTNVTSALLWKDYVEKRTKKSLSLASLAPQTTKREMWERAFLQWLRLSERTSVEESSMLINRLNVQEEKQQRFDKLKNDVFEFVRRGVTSPIWQSDTLNSIEDNHSLLQRQNTSDASRGRKIAHNCSENLPREYNNDLLPSKKMINIPYTLHIPMHDYLPHTCVKTENFNNTEMTSSHVAPMQTSSFRSSESTDNQEFLTKLEQAGLTQSEVNKQLRFQQTLLDFKNIVESTLHIRFFLACGTALAAHREGYFVKHDDDIDVGIFYNDLIAQGKKESTKASAITNTNDNLIDSMFKSSRRSEDKFSTSTVTSTENRREHNGVTYAQDVIYKLLNALVIDNLFVIFDICGEVSKGLEVRLLHSKTNVKLDINVYYPPLELACSNIESNKDEDKIDEQHSNKNRNGVSELCIADEEYVWCGTYYEDAHRRKHKMYRYRHTPFAHALTRLYFCDKESSATHYVSNKQNKICTLPGFWVPPQSYLAENYGDDWVTPRVITYHDGVHGQYPNIIKEE